MYHIPGRHHAVLRFYCGYYHVKFLNVKGLDQIKGTDMLRSPEWLEMEASDNDEDLTEEDGDETRAGRRCLHR
ncbi:hypothetical protein BV898_06590 [Hypsibius exemplaris]|uniref:Uncharacterized protein n=1 Tax=Hypsibius exemplaris TaxID=2072580 RepID=A0A1W0WVW8_HYPEX|nr:hypothetical protein BV898_06590 [Hypsibius exemplaris]